MSPLIVRSLIVDVRVRYEIVRRSFVDRIVEFVLPRFPDRIVDPVDPVDPVDQVRTQTFLRSRSIPS